MIDTVRLKLSRFKIINKDNFFRVTKAGTIIPYINTLTDNGCYRSIPSDGNYQEFHLKSHIKYEPLGYRPAKIIIKDIPKQQIRFWLVIEVSLPKVFYGHNFYEIHDAQFEAIINSIYDMLLQFGIQIDIEELRVTTGISRVDYCKNILIKSSAKSFANLMQKFQKSRSRTYDKYETSVLFANKQQGLTVYDKVEEVTKILRKKSYNNRTSKEFEVARILNEHKKIHDLEVIRVEHRLLNRQTIKRELSPLINSPYPFTLREIFNAKVGSQLLMKHWSKTISEEKLKLLLLGEQNLSTLFDGLVSATHKASFKFNPYAALYIKLLSEVGEKAADKRILRIKSHGSLNSYKKELLEVAKEVFFMTRDLRTIERFLKQLVALMFSTVPLFQRN